MAENDAENKIDHEDPGKIIDEIISSYDEIQGNLLRGVTLAGKEKEKYQGIKPTWEELSETVTSDPDKAKVYQSGVNALASYRDDLDEFKPKVPEMTDEFEGFIVSSNSTASTTTGTVSAFSNELVDLPVRVTLPGSSVVEKTESKLSQIDEALSDTYSSIREVLYGTQSDPERGALFLTRQLFDHFFGLLSPDDMVKKSNLWEPHNELEDPEIVTRHDRIIYAANKHISNPQKRRTQIENARHLVNVYNVMHKAHKRGELESDRAREALKELVSLIESWVFVIDIPLTFNDKTT